MGRTWVHDNWRGVPRLSFAQPCLCTVITMWPPEPAKWILKTFTEQSSTVAPGRECRHAPDKLSLEQRP